MLDKLPTSHRWYVEELGKKLDLYPVILTPKLKLLVIILIRTNKTPDEKHFFKVKFLKFLFSAMAETK